MRFGRFGSLGRHYPAKYPTSKRPTFWRRRTSGSEFSLLALAGIALAFYFTQAAIWGKKGLMAQNQLELRLEAAELKLADLKETRSRLEDRLARLGGEVIDRDLLDEIVRTGLNYGARGEIVLIDPNVSSDPTGLSE